MISYIVASHDPKVLRDNLSATVACAPGDEVVVVRDAVSIAAAYNEGQSRARNPIRCYVHNDVRVLKPERLRAELIAHCTPAVGLVGIVGSRDARVPWWEGVTCGSVVDARMGLLDFGPGGECAYLDGLLLASVHALEWDESYPGFHLYDHDICQQSLARGFTNFCLDGGQDLVFHNTRGSTDVHKLASWDENVARFRSKWRL